VCVVKPCVVLELFVKGFSCFLNGVAAEKCNVRKKEENKRKLRVTLQNLFFLLPCFFPYFSCLYSYSAEFL
jgi:hypothetical protein